MNLTGRRPTAPEYESWKVHDVDLFAQELVRSGRADAQHARERAAREFEDLLPQGLDTPTATVLRLEEDGIPVGWLWVGHTAPSGVQGVAWVCNVELDETARGRGLGRAAMLLAEQIARDVGATHLGLNVFGHNTVARRLYEGLGYDTMSVQMRKPL